MAIEFLCPSCAARIRVPEGAQGKQGSCPQCRRKLIVPFLPESQREASPPESPEPRVSLLSSGTEPTVVELNSTAKPDHKPGRQSYRGGSRKWRRIGVILSLVVLVGLGTGLVYYNWPRPLKLEGELSGESLENFESAEFSIDRKELPGDAKTNDSLIQALKENPAEFISELSTVTISGTSQGLLIEVRETLDSQFVRIDPKADLNWRRYLNTLPGDWETPRQQEMTEGLREFLAAWKSKIEGERIIDAANYRERLAWSALNKGMGWRLEASAGKYRIRCVFEDSDGKLYFLVPVGAKQLEVFGRDSSFPGRYQISIKESKKPRPSEKSKDQSDETFEEPPPDQMQEPEVPETVRKKDS